VAGLRDLLAELDPTDVLAGDARPFYDVSTEAQTQLSDSPSSALGSGWTSAARRCRRR
jgi:hypothetical protein